MGYYEGTKWGYNGNYVGFKWSRLKKITASRHICFFCRVELVVQYPAGGRSSTQVLWCIFLVCCGLDTSHILSVHIQCQASIYTLSLCRGRLWRVRLAKQETLTPPGHLVSPLVCRGPWMFTVVLYCWCHCDSTSVLLYFTITSVMWT